MTNPFNYFEAIYCINRDDRADRWNDCIKEFKEVKILDRVIRYPAQKSHLPIHARTQSQLEIIEIVKEQNLKNVLIFEDDVRFINNPTEIFTKAINQIHSEWELFYFGANLHENLEAYSENLAILKNAVSSHAVAYSHLVYDRFIKYANEMPIDNNKLNVIDMWLMENIQPSGKSLVVNPIIATQRASFSDIENTMTDYRFIEVRAERFLPNKYKA